MIKPVIIISALLLLLPASLALADNTQGQCVSDYQSKLDQNNAATKTTIVSQACSKFLEIMAYMATQKTKYARQYLYTMTPATPTQKEPNIVPATQPSSQPQDQPTTTTTPKAPTIRYF